MAGDIVGVALHFLSGRIVYAAYEAPRGSEDLDFPVPGQAPPQQLPTASKDCVVW
jgi:hypothetical protein